MTERGRRWTTKLLHSHSWGRRKRLRARYRGILWKAGRSWRRIRSVTYFLFMRRRVSFLASFFLAALQFTCRYGVLPVTLYAFGELENPLPLILMQGLVFALQLVVVMPGGGGAVELVSSLVLPLFAPRSITAPVVVIWRFFTYHLYLIAGGFVFFRKIKMIEGTRDEQEIETADSKLPQRGMVERSEAAFAEKVDPHA